MLIQEFLKVSIFDFKRPLKILSYDDVGRLHGFTPNNYSFIKHVKVITAFPVHWNEGNYHHLTNFSVLREGQRNKLFFWENAIGQFICTVLESKIKILPTKRQQKWCDALQILSNDIEWSKVYKNNYFATNETKLRSFQIRLNMRSIVTNVQFNGFGIVDSIIIVFCFEDLKQLIIYFVCVNMLRFLVKKFLVGFRLNFITILT